MIRVIKEIQEDWYLIHLEDTRYYQIWNKWDMFQLLLDATQTDLNKPKPYMVLWDEDLPLSEDNLKDIVNKLKQNKQNGTKINN